MVRAWVYNLKKEDVLRYGSEIGVDLSGSWTQCGGDSWASGCTSVLPRDSQTGTSEGKTVTSQRNRATSDAGIGPQRESRRNKPRPPQHTCHQRGRSSATQATQHMESHLYATIGVPDSETCHHATGISEGGKVSAGVELGLIGRRSPWSSWNKLSGLRRRTDRMST